MEASIKKNISIIPAKPAYDRSIRPQMRTLRVAAYCRVSTLMEQQESSYEAQVQYYTEKIKSNPNWKLAGIYADDGKSATSTRKRADFQSMIDDCMAGKIDMVITKSISRFARNTVDSLTNIRKLKEKNIAVFFEKEGINTLEGSGELLITILSSQAQEESRAISTNVKYFYQDQPGCAAASANVKLEELKNRCIGSGRWLSWGLFVQITKITPERSHHIPGADIVSVVLYPCSGFLQ